MPAALIPLIGFLLKSLIVRIIIAMGLTLITYTGYQIALSQFKEYTQDAIQSMPADLFNLLMIAGVGQGLGYLFGAFAFTISLKAMTKLTFLFPN